jgi:multiple antibiotic resistance protein
MPFTTISLQEILYAAAPLIALTNPVAEIGIFLAIIEGRAPRRDIAAAVEVGVGVLLVLGVSTFAGIHLLNWVGISVPAFRSAGGLLLVVMGLQMAHGEDPALQSVGGASDMDDQLWVPLVMPMLAGPGAIVTVISLSLREETIRSLPIATLIAVVISALVVMGTLLLAARVTRPIGPRARRILTRFSGLILVGIGFQMGFTGVAEFFQLAQP